VAKKVIHPNFRIGPGQKNIHKRNRAILFMTTQEAYDAILTEVDHGRAGDAHEVLERAVETYLNLEKGSASIKSSDSR
jgi:hypothetical protein